MIYFSYSISFPSRLNFNNIFYFFFLFDFISLNKIFLIISSVKSSENLLASCITFIISNLLLDGFSFFLSFSSWILSLIAVFSSLLFSIIIFSLFSLSGSLFLSFLLSSLISLSFESIFISLFSCFEFLDLSGLFSFDIILKLSLFSFLFF